MKTNHLLVPVLAALGLAALPASATIYSDPTGDVFTGAGGGILDITSVEVTSGATDLNFKINLAGDPVATDWGKYMIGLDTAPGGDTAGNGWARPIGLSSGMDYWVGSWADSGNGAEIWKYTGSWGLQSATYGANPDLVNISKTTSSVTLNFQFAGLGLAPGSTILFDVYTSGGGATDGAVDSLANPTPTISDWGNYYSGPGVSYTIPVVPEPATCVLLGLGSLVLVRRVLRRNA